METQFNIAINSFTLNNKTFFLLINEFTNVYYTMNVKQC